MKDALSKELPIILDAMGGDFAPQAMVEGAVLAAQDGVPVLLVGREDLVRAELARHDAKNLPITVEHAEEAMGMDEQATDVRRRPELSINVAVRLLKEGRGAALVAQGHTGATLVAALFGLGRLPGAERPAILADLPTTRGRVVLVDVGANADCRAQFLQQFALMGTAYVQAMYGLDRPSVGILSIGEEPGKGNALAIDAYLLLENTPGINFYGNIEGRDILKGTTDVVVTDGFTGNVVLKFAEGEARVLFGWIREALLGGNVLTKLGARLVRNALRAVGARMDPSEYGAQPLLGVPGLVFIGHGSSDARAVRAALRMAQRAVKANLLERVGERMLELTLHHPAHSANS